MKIGISLTPNGNRQTTPRDSVKHLMWAAQFADEQGFDIVWSTEHHFTQVAYSSSPSVILSQYAALTKNARLGYAVAILPFHHPVRLAEDMAWIDQFSDGRLIAGVSPGWAAYEFSVFNVSLTDRRERFEDEVDILKKALTGERFSHDSAFYHVPDTQIMPTPVQAGTMPFVSATTSEEGIQMCARKRMSPIFGFDNLEGLTERRDRYIGYLREDGATEDEISRLLTHLGCLRRVLIRDSDEDAEEEAIQAVSAQRNVSAQLNNDANTNQPIEGIVRRRRDDDPDDPRKAYAFGGTLKGTPETVVQQLLELKKIGLGHLVMQFHTTTRDTDGVKENMRRFGREVLPAYRAATAVPA